MPPAGHTQQPPHPSHCRNSHQPRIWTGDGPWGACEWAHLEPAHSPQDRASGQAGVQGPRHTPGCLTRGSWTHYLCIRETMVLKAAWTSAAEHVHTTGSVCLCRTSDRNWG